MNRIAHLFEGLTLKRVLLVTVLCIWAAGATVWFFANTYLDLLVSALCVGYTSMVLFTVATNVRAHRLPRWVIQVASIVVGSFLGTMLAGVVKGRDIATMFTERYYGVLITMGLGIGFGCMALWVYVFRERESRHAAELARAQAERAQLEKNVLQAQLALMQAQVEPHFLFNTLANVQHLVETDPASASRMLESLIQYLRGALPRMREDTTTVGRELDMAKSFLDIHRMRMGSRLDYVRRGARGAALPPLPADDAHHARRERGDPRRRPLLRGGHDHDHAPRRRTGGCASRWRTPARASRRRRARGSGSSTSASGSRRSTGVARAW